MRQWMEALVPPAGLKCLAQQRLNGVDDLNLEDLPPLFSPPAAAAH